MATWGRTPPAEALTMRRSHSEQISEAAMRWPQWLQDKRIRRNGGRHPRYPSHAPTQHLHLVGGARRSKRRVLPGVWPLPPSLVPNWAATYPPGSIPAFRFLRWRSKPKSLSATLQKITCNPPEVNNLSL